MPDPEMFGDCANFGDRGGAGQRPAQQGWTLGQHSPGDSCSKEALPPTLDHELEFIIKDALSYTVGQSVRSQSKIVGNFRYKILVFPSGTATTNGLQVSAFVEADPLEGLDPRWQFQGVKYQVSIVNWVDYRSSVTKSDIWTFSKDGIDRGWHDMVKTSELSLEKGWLGPDNSLCIRGMCCVRTSDTIFVGGDYNVRRETGYVGLKNHGATCYMNGLLQNLFHIGEFRKIVYSAEIRDAPEARADKDGMDVDSPVKDDDGEVKAPSLVQSLQNVFYKLQTSDQAVNCRELMKSFGWDQMDAFTQHDAQELNRILCDRLEEQMKGTPMDGSIKRLFEGEMENYIECIDVDYKSKRNETFYDIQLNIKGERGQEMQNIEESLRDFTAEETLEGDNLYEAEGHGKQRAKKGIRFLRFPPVLNLQLKRFHFDLERMDMVKLNSRFEFPHRLDLSAFAPGAGTYLLQAIVVHSGDVNSGHYYVHIRPNMEQGWFKFDDDSVTPCSEHAAVNDNFGGSDFLVWQYFDRSPYDISKTPPPKRPRIHNAYMLVYVREDMAADILQPPDPKATNFGMVERCDREVQAVEQRRREQREQQLRIRVRLVFERDLRKMNGFWDHADIPHSQTIKMSRDYQIKDLMAEVESLTEIPRANMALFILQYRNNPPQVRFALAGPSTTFRSHIPHFNCPHFDAADPFLTMLVVASKGYDVQSFEWKPAREGQKPHELHNWHDETSILLLVKYFCPITHAIVSLGCYYGSYNDLLITMVNDGWVMERLEQYVETKEVAPLPASRAWECFEEFSERDIQPRNAKRSAKSEQLWSGDVIIWQLSTGKDGGAGGVGAAGEPAPLSPASGRGDGFEAPLYPILNVADFSAHQANSIDITIKLHDPRQPLCVDGVVSSGHWGPSLRRQPSGGVRAEETEEESNEVAALQASSAPFQMPVEKDLKMDLRWNLGCVTGSISREFGLEHKPGEKRLWLFHGAPSSTADEPLYVDNPRDDRTTLRELQRSAMMYVASNSKKPLSLHVLELTSGGWWDRGLAPCCVRFFDDAVREVGSTVMLLPSGGTVADLLAEARGSITPEMGISGPLRVVEVADGRLAKVYHGAGAPDTPLQELACAGRCNIFFNCVRVESDPEAGGVPDGHQLIEIYHCDRNSQQAFGQPYLLPAAPGEKVSSLKNRCRAKLAVTEQEFKSWRLVRSAGARKTLLKDDDPWDGDGSPDACQPLCLEHVHPNPNHSVTRQARYNKPLTIK